MTLQIRNDYTKELTAKLQPIMDTLPAMIKGQYGERYAEEVPQLQVHSDDETGEYHFCIKSRNLGSILSYRVGRFPSCCALDLFHCFKHMETMTTEMVDTILDASLHNFMDARNHRLQLMMVESRDKMILEGENGPNYPGKILDRTHSEGIPMLPFDQVQKKIQYPHFFNYFHKRGKVNTHLMYNGNTSNIIHSMVVLLNKTGVQ